MLLSFLICCSFRVIRYIVKRTQVLIKLWHRNIFWFTFPIASLFFQTGFYAKQLFIFQLWYHQLYYINCVTTVRLHFHILKQHYRNTFTGPSLFQRAADSCFSPAPCNMSALTENLGKETNSGKNPLSSRGGEKLFFNHISSLLLFNHTNTVQLWQHSRSKVHPTIISTTDTKEISMEL